MQRKRSIDINADLGEGAGNDEEIMPLISSCNIACGGHYGDETSIDKTIRLAQHNGVKIGAHPSFPDRENFGRRMLDLSPSELLKSLQQQLSLFQRICREEGASLHHIKAHGALYTQGANHSDYVRVLAELPESLTPTPVIFLQEHSLLYQQIKDRFPVKREAFIDRRYADGNALVSRNKEGALITEKEEAWKQLYGIYRDGELTDIEGHRRKLSADTFCIHGDQPGAVKMLEYIHWQLEQNGISLS